MKKFLRLIFITFLLTGISCEENAFLDFESDETDSSYWFEAKKLINENKFQEAIDVLVNVSDAYKLKRENLVQYASAYAGLCGLDLLELVSESSGLGTSTPLAFFVSVFRDPSIIKLQACQQAISIIEDNTSIDAVDRNDEENIAMMAIHMAAIGVYLGLTFDLDNDGDIDAADLAHNGTCSAVPMADAEARQLGVSLSKMFDSASQLSVIDVLGDIKDTISQGCDGLVVLSLDFCSVKDPAALSANQIRGIRTLLQEGQIFGVGTCTGSPNDLVNCVCI